MVKTKNFDASKAYEETVKPLVEKYRSVCIREKLPVFLTFAVKGDERTTTYETMSMHGPVMPSDGKTVSDVLSQIDRTTIEFPEQAANFDKTEIFESDLKPLINEMEVYCLRERIPMLAVTALSCLNGEVGYKAFMILGETFVSLADNRISDILLFWNGFAPRFPVWFEKAADMLQKYELYEDPEHITEKEIEEAKEQIQDYGNRIHEFDVPYKDIPPLPDDRILVCTRLLYESPEEHEKIRTVKVTHSDEEEDYL